jgi:vesicle-fusing ATPase
MFELLTTLPY